MVGIPAPAMVGKSVRVGAGAPVESEVTNELEEPPDALELVRSAEEEDSVVDASVEVAVVLLEVDFAVVVVASSVWSLSSGRSSWAYAIGDPARASSASSCVFFAMRTMFAVPTACLSNERLRRGCCGVTRRSSICAVGSIRLFVSSLP